MGKKVKAMDFTIGEGKVGIYQILNIKNNKRYIGKSIDIRNRWMQHLGLLYNSKHHSPKLQRSWDKNGFDSFNFSILEECSVEELGELELKYIKKYSSSKNGYNCVLENKNYSCKKALQYYCDDEDNVKCFVNKLKSILSFDSESEYLMNNFYKIESYKTLRNITKSISNIKCIEDLYDLIHALYYNKKHKYVIVFIDGIEDILADYKGFHKEEIVKFISKNKISEEFL